MATKRDQITELAIGILKAHPDGLHFAEIKRMIRESHPDFAVGTVHGTVYRLTKMEDVVEKVSPGVYRLVEFGKAQDATPSVPVVTSPKVKEEDFYKPFAEWLETDVEECTRAIPLGGSVFKDKWGTPDVIGKKEPGRSDIIKAPTEIVTAEIKTDTAQLITAFGQACAYRLFSHRTYLVVPQQASSEELSRLDALCGMCGIGLILFDALNPADPRFGIRVRAAKHEPDHFYMNRCLKVIEKDLFPS